MTKIRMPKTKAQSVVFTMIAAWLMVYPMTIYNIVTATGSFTNATFLIALKEMWIEYVIIAAAAFFASGYAAKAMAFRYVTPQDRPIAITLTIQTFMVLMMVGLGSLLGLSHTVGYTSNFIPDYISMYCHNFILAYPLQIFLAGPLARCIFGLIFKD